MKIDQNVTFLKPAAGSSAPAVSRNSVNAGTPAPLKTAEAGQAQPLSPTPLLPSIHGDFDAARVAEIRESISAGRYQVNPGKIADGLLASVRDLLNSKAP
jgi:negative regulator of flagellin synthesis FlgM